MSRRAASHRREIPEQLVSAQNMPTFAPSRLIRSSRCGRKQRRRPSCGRQVVTGRETVLIMDETHLTDPIEYFAADDFAESLVIEIRHTPDKEMLQIVVAIANVAAILADKCNTDQRLVPGFDRDFRGLIFSGVGAISRVGGTIADGFRGFHASELAVPPGFRPTLTVNWIAIKELAGGYSACVSISNIGTYSFDFKQFSARRILARAVKTGEAMWEYFDIETGRRFDFWYPFV